MRRCSFSSSVLARFLCHVSYYPRASVLTKATYLGGKFVLGTGSSWPHDFRFFAGFFSSGLTSCVFTSALSKDVSAGETVNTGTSDAGVEGNDSTEDMVFSISQDIVIIRWS